MRHVVLLKRRTRLCCKPGISSEILLAEFPSFQETLQGLSVVPVDKCDIQLLDYSLLIPMEIESE